VEGDMGDLPYKLGKEMGDSPLKKCEMGKRLKHLGHGRKGLYKFERCEMKNETNNKREVQTQSWHELVFHSVRSVRTLTITKGNVALQSIYSYVSSRHISALRD
jgi:hypothetical protein